MPLKRDPCLFCSIPATSLPQVASQPASVQPTFRVPDPAPSLGGELQLDTKVPGSLLQGSVGSRAPCHTGKPWPTLLSLHFLRAWGLKVS